MSTSLPTKPDYGVDAPAVMRNFFLIGTACLLFAIFSPRILHLGPVELNARSFYWPAGFLLAEGFLFLLYVKVGKFRHRDFILSLHPWRGDEQVLDVGCGRGLLLAGAAKRISALSGTGHATGIDVWSNVDMGGNSSAATQHNLDLEGISQYCTLLGQRRRRCPSPTPPSTSSSPTSASTTSTTSQLAFRLSTRSSACSKPGGIALLSDYKLTGEYARELAAAGLIVEKRRGSLITTFPPLTVVIARKPM